MSRVSRRSRARFYARASLAVVFIILTLVTIARPDWIEALSGASPDRGSGVWEIGLTIAPAAATLLLSIAARREWTRAGAA